MRVHATPGDTYAFPGTPTVTYCADCIDCAAKAWATPHHEFTTAAARDKFVKTHETYDGHRVAVSTEVQAGTKCL